MATNPPAWAVAPSQPPPQQSAPPQQQQQQPPQPSQAHYQPQNYNQRPSGAMDPNMGAAAGGHPQHPQHPSQYAFSNHGLPPTNPNSTTRPTVASIPAKPTHVNHRASTTSSFLNPPPRGAGITTSTPDEELEDGRVRNAEAVTKIRDAWIYTQISARAAEFTQHQDVSFFSSFKEG